MAIRVVSTGAPKGGISGCAAAFERVAARPVAVEFVTAPVLRERLENGTVEADVIVAPVARMDAFEAEGHLVPGIRTIVGSVRAGVVIRDGAEVPDISTAAALKAAILSAESVVYNVATSGQYIAQMMERLGVAEKIEDRVTRVPNGSAVMMHLAESPLDNEFGFAQLTEIRVHEERGIPVSLVGPLPPGLENVTTYAAGVFIHARFPDDAGVLIDFMASADGREIRAASGLAVE